MDWEPYLDQEAQLPREGHVIVGQHDADTIVVYQAYKPAIARWAVDQQRLGGPHFSMTRMSWIKPSFLWMMYRCGWARKADQEHVLALRIRRPFFDQAVRDAVPAQFDPTQYADRDQWKQAVTRSDVRVQWDPDRSPDGGPKPRRAIQLGLRGEVLRTYVEEATLAIEDITLQVREQAIHVEQQAYDKLMIPVQRPL